MTHLVEHAAIRTAGPQHSLDGAVGLLETRFECFGGEDRVVAGLAALCAALRDLPSAGLEVERRVLAAEAAATGTALAHLLLYERCGPRGVGVAVLDELGLRALDDDAVREWAARWFVRGNAALWLSGPPPAGLRLELPGGERAQAPAVLPLPGLALPARVDGPAGAVGVGALASSDRRDDVLPVLLAAALERRAHDALRTTLGVSYDVDGRAERVSGDARHVVLAADCQPEHAAGAGRTLLAAWRDVAGGDAIEDGREHVLRTGALVLAEPEGQRAALERNAGRLLAGQAVSGPAAGLERLRAADAGEVAALAGALFDQVIARAGRARPSRGSPRRRRSAGRDPRCTRARPRGPTRRPSRAAAGSRRRAVRPHLGRGTGARPRLAAAGLGRGDHRARGGQPRVDDWPRAAIVRASGRDIAVAARLTLHLSDGENVTLWVGPRGRLARLVAELNSPPRVDDAVTP